MEQNQRQERVQAKGWSIFGQSRPLQRKAFHVGGWAGEAGKSILSFRAIFSPRQRIFPFERKNMNFHRNRRLNSQMKYISNFKHATLKSSGCNLITSFLFFFGSGGNIIFLIAPSSSISTISSKVLLHSFFDFRLLQNMQKFFSDTCLFFLQLNRK